MKNEINVDFSIIICTIDRNRMVVALVDQIIENHKLFNYEIVIVENSGNRNLVEDLRSKIKKVQCSERILVVETTPGLAHARNLGFQICSGKFIVFLDDDIEIHSNFLDPLSSIFGRDQEIVGIGGRILGDIPKHNSRLERYLVTQEGKVKKSGRAYWFYGEITEKEVDWIPGCFMAYRRRVLLSLQFNIGLENGPTGGYSLGEDLDFSLKAASLGKLVATPRIEVIHNLALNQRTNWKFMDEGIGRLLAHLTRNFPGKIKLSWVVTYLLLDFIRALVSKVVPGIDPRNRVPWERILSFYAEMKNPILLTKIDGEDK